MHSSGHQIKRSLKRSSQTRVRLRCERDPTSIRPDCWKNCAFCGTKPGPVGHVDLQKRRRLCWVGRLVGIFPTCKFGPMEEQLTYCGGKYTPRSIWPTSDANVLLQLVLLHIGPFHQLITQFRPGQSVWREKEAQQHVRVWGVFLDQMNQTTEVKAPPRLAFIFF